MLRRRHRLHSPNMSLTTRQSPRRFALRKERDLKRPLKLGDSLCDGGLQEMRVDSGRGNAAASCDLAERSHIAQIQIARVHIRQALLKL